MSYYVFDISRLTFDQIAELIAEVNVEEIKYKEFYTLSSLDNGSSLELPWLVVISNHDDALIAMLKWNLTPSTNTTSDI